MVSRVLGFNGALKTNSLMLQRLNLVATHLDSSLSAGTASRGSARYTNHDDGDVYVDKTDFMCVSGARVSSSRGMLQGYRSRELDDHAARRINLRHRFLAFSLDAEKKATSGKPKSTRKGTFTPLTQPWR